MNERIKELIQEADSKCSETRGVFDEILVQLVVRECCKVLYDNELGGYQVNYVLKEHFGIE